MDWKAELNEDCLPWLLEETDPGVNYLALRNLLDTPADDPQLQKAAKQAHTRGPITAVLDQMDPEGWWLEPGPGYMGKYRSTVWAVILLAQLGADPRQDERITTGCEYLLENALAPRGQFTSSGTPGGTAACLQGNLCAALLDLGYGDDPLLEQAFDWLARSITGEGVAPPVEKQAPLRYYAGTCGPDFLCGSNDKRACAWGAVKEGLALSKLPADKRTPLIEDAIQHSIDFLLSIDPAESSYPSGYAAKPSGNWWKFGFPVFYVTDLLQNLEALLGLGLAGDPRLENALMLVHRKQDMQGRWPLEYDYTGKTWVDFGPKKQPNKWVTLRALKVLKAASEQ